MSVSHYQLPLSSDTNVPAWLTTGLSLAIPVLGTVVSLTDPSGKINTASAQALLILGACLIGALIHVVVLIGRNGISKAGIAKDISQEEAWIRENGQAIISLFEQAKPAVDQISGVSGVLTSLQTDVSDVKLKLSQIPAIDRTSVENLVRTIVPELVIPNVLTAAAPVTAATPTVTQ